MFPLLLFDGLANNTPWYITPLTSIETTKEFSVMLEMLKPIPVVDVVLPEGGGVGIVITVHLSIHTYLNIEILHY